LSSHTVAAFGLQRTQNGGQRFTLLSPVDWLRMHDVLAGTTHRTRLAVGIQFRDCSPGAETALSPW